MKVSDTCRAAVLFYLALGITSCTQRVVVSSTLSALTRLSKSGDVALSAVPTAVGAGMLTTGEYIFESGASPVLAVPNRLSGLPDLEGIRVRTYGSSVDIEFDRVAAAQDYRVYTLPSDGDIELNSNGTLSVANAVYRCAGARPGGHINTPDILNSPAVNNTFSSRVTGTSEGQGFNRQEAEKLMGYVTTVRFIS